MTPRIIWGIHEESPTSEGISQEPCQNQEPTPMALNIPEAREPTAKAADQD